MKAPACDWAWMAEVGDDRRLSEEQQTAFRRHVERCAPCAQAVRDVIGLRERIEAIPLPALSDFQHHRQRQLLLARAGGIQARSFRSAWPRVLALSALAAALVGVGAWRFGKHGFEAVAAVPRYEVTALTEASWTNEEAGRTARVRLTRGSAAFHVHKLNAGQRFFVTLPDGEIEVRGTRFVVEIEGDRTKYVVVMEGKVALRLGEGTERLLLAGDRWDASRPAPSAVANPETPRAVAPRVAATTAPSIEDHAANRPGIRPPVRASAQRHVARSDGAEPLPVNQSRAAESGAKAPAMDPPPNLFARGINAFRAGRYSEAEGFWREFVVDRPQDPRVEDIAFLRAVARSRLGDAEGAAGLARAYLQRFPRGMRRKEAEALVRHATP